MAYTQAEYQSLLDRLRALADPDYKAFHARLVPGLLPETLLGVRLPDLRREARAIAQGGFRGFLGLAQDGLYEERMLQGLVIGLAKCPLAERLSLCAAFIPKIDNWAVCDAFCGGLKCARKERAAVYAFLRPYLASLHPYAVRFACVMLMNYYLDAAYIDAVLSHYGHVTHPDYYVKMAVAWGVSMALVHQRDKTLAYLASPGCGLDDFTYNKALQKARESYRVSPADKARLQAMKR